MRWAVFATPRTGSHLLRYALYPYLRAKYSYDGDLGEFFNARAYKRLYLKQDRGDHWVTTPEPGCLSPYFKLEAGRIVESYDPTCLRYSTMTQPDIIRDHLRLLRESNGLYFFSTFPCDIALFYADGEFQGERLLREQAALGTSIFDNLSEYRAIRLYRRDIRAQVYSFMLSTATRRFHVYEGESRPNVGEGSIIGEMKNFLFMKRQIHDWWNTKTTGREIAYEDFADLSDKRELLDLIGFSDWREYDIELDRRPIKQNDSEIDRYFLNRDEIDTWIKTI